jgi:hypothetical protein
LRFAIELCGERPVESILTADKEKSFSLQIFMKSSACSKSGENTASSTAPVRGEKATAESLTEFT